MKAGILTFHEADNYGAVLQAWALQQTLKKLGAESEFLSVKTPPAPVQTLPAGPAALFLRRVQAEGEKRAALFRQFRESRMVCSKAYEKEALSEAAGDYDLFLAGSDQIWNFRIPGADERYFLPFAPREKRFSYAASFGSEDLPEKAKEWCAGQLERFARISVREESGRRIVKELTGRDAAVSLDPTLLLEPEDWKDLFPETEREPYMLLFLLKYDESLAARAKQAAEEAGVALKTVTAAFMPQCGFSAWSSVGVGDWVGLVAGASGVFTNSFHGTVFSLLFQRPLSVAWLGGELSSRNGRIEELLKRAGLEEALDGGPVCLGNGVFRERIGKAREESLNYLKEVLRDADAV